MENETAVLLIDDDEDEYILLKGMFARLPGQPRRYRLEWSRDAEEAVRSCRTRQYDLYLVDYYLGQQTGLQVMNLLRAQNCKGPFILLTGQGSYELDLAAMEQGVSDYLLKDQLNEYVLERSLRYAMERSQIQEELERRVQERTAALSQSEERFRTLTETTSAAIFIMQDDKIRYANPAVRFVTGYEPGELQDQELWRLAHPAYQNLLRQERAAASWAGGIPARYETKFIHRSGEERWLDVTSGQLTYQGRPAVLVTAFDITERDRAERELRQVKEGLEQRVAERTREARAALADAHQRAEELDGLQRATMALLSTLDLNHMFTQILSAAQSAIPSAEKGLLCLVTSQGSLRAPSAVLGYPNGRSSDLENEKIPEALVLAAEEHHPVLLAGETAISPEDGAWIACPLIVEDRVLGVLALGSDQQDAFTTSNLLLLQAFAAAATTALQNAMLHEEMKSLAEGDPLTGKYNRRAFFEIGQYELERARRAGHPVAAVMMDVDNFKQINDTYGHPTGDQVLRAVADICRSKIRESDVFGRYGGDEFVILLPHSEIGTASTIAQRILAAVTALKIPVEPGGQDVPISISVGVARDRPGLRDLAALVHEADQALYSAKRDHKGKVKII